MDEEKINYIDIKKDLKKRYYRKIIAVVTEINNKI